MEALIIRKKAHRKKADGAISTKTDWDDWGGYMQAKVQKLDVQFQEEVQQGTQDIIAPKIFEKVVIHINGYTVPPADELRRLVYLHGGRYQQYYRKRTVTHIIATNLPDSKIKDIRDELVVHPSWILDSVKAGKLLPVEQFLLYQPRKAAQKTLSFAIKSLSVASSTLPCGPSADEGNSETILSTTASNVSPSGVSSYITSSMRLTSVPLTEEASSAALGADASISSLWGVSSSVCSTSLPPPEEIILGPPSTSAPKPIPRGPPSETTSTVSTHGGLPSLPSAVSSTSLTRSIGVIPSEAASGMHSAHYVNSPSGSDNVDKGHGQREETRQLQKSQLPSDSVVDEEMEDAGELMPGAAVAVDTSDAADTNLSIMPENTPSKKENKATLPRACDPNFVTEFYNNSRLHYLSTWGAEFKKYTSDVIKSRISTEIKCRGTGRVGPYGRVIMHIDMDSFFVSVTLRDEPHLRGKPIAVCHAGKGSAPIEQGSTNRQLISPTKPASFFSSMSEIASCSYEARAVGVRNGMFLGPARKLCPDIYCVPYQFDKYKQVSQKLYDILVTCSHEIEAVSCDEAYIDVSERLEENEAPIELGEKIRAQIREATGCNASVGISFNILLARMSTRKAKPDGCFYLAPTDDVNKFIGPHRVEDLPGVGWSLRDKLQSQGVKTCADLQNLSLQLLQREFGPKTGLLLYQYSRGIDDRALKTERERKSVSAEINYGIRFTKESEVEMFIQELAEEVHKRLQALGTKGRCITLKMKVRKAGAPVPRKFMGHGMCDNIARSFTLPNVTDDTNVIMKQCHALLKQLSVTPEDLRGMGIQISKLEDKDGSSANKNARSLLDFVKPQARHEKDVEVVRENQDQSESEVARKELESPARHHDNLPPLPRFSPQIVRSAANSNSATESRVSDLGESLYLPSPSQIDRSVFDALPEDIRRSIEKSYAARNQRLSLDRTEKQQEDVAFQQPPPEAADTRNKRKKSNKPIALCFEEAPSLAAVSAQDASTNRTELLLSPSQIDPEFLAALPDDVRQEIEQAYKLTSLHSTRAPAQERPSRVPVRNNQVNEGTKTSTNTGTRDGTSEVGTKCLAQQRQVNLGGAVTLAEVKEVVKQWTDTYEVPVEEDISVFIEYLLDLVETQNLEQLWRILKFLDRRTRGRDDWQVACAEVLSKVQPLLLEKYGCKLPEDSLMFSRLYT